MLIVNYSGFDYPLKTKPITCVYYTLERRIYRSNANLFTIMRIIALVGV